MVINPHKIPFINLFTIQRMCGDRADSRAEPYDSVHNSGLALADQRPEPVCQRESTQYIAREQTLTSEENCVGFELNRNVT